MNEKRKQLIILSVTNLLWFILLYLVHANII